MIIIKEQEKQKKQKEKDEKALLQKEIKIKKKQQDLHAKEEKLLEKKLKKDTADKVKELKKQQNEKDKVAKKLAKEIKALQNAKEKEAKKKSKQAEKTQNDKMSKKGSSGEAKLQKLQLQQQEYKRRRATRDEEIKGLENVIAERNEEILNDEQELEKVVSATIIVERDDSVSADHEEVSTVESSAELKVVDKISSGANSNRRNVLEVKSKGDANDNNKQSIQETKLKVQTHLDKVDSVKNSDSLTSSSESDEEEEEDEEEQQEASKKKEKPKKMIKKKNKKAKDKEKAKKKKAKKKAKKEAKEKKKAAKEEKMLQAEAEKVRKIDLKMKKRKSEHEERMRKMLEKHDNEMRKFHHVRVEEITKNVHTKQKEEIEHKNLIEKMKSHANHDKLSKNKPLPKNNTTTEKVAVPVREILDIFAGRDAGNATQLIEFVKYIQGHPNEKPDVVIQKLTRKVLHGQKKNCKQDNQELQKEIKTLKFALETCNETNDRQVSEYEDRIREADEQIAELEGYRDNAVTLVRQVQAMHQQLHCMVTPGEYEKMEGRVSMLNKRIIKFKSERDRLFMESNKMAEQNGLLKCQLQLERKHAQNGEKRFQNKARMCDNYQQKFLKLEQKFDEYTQRSIAEQRRILFEYGYRVEENKFKGDSLQVIA